MNLSKEEVLVDISYFEAFVGMTDNVSEKKKKKKRTRVFLLPFVILNFFFIYIQHQEASPIIRPFALSVYYANAEKIGLLVDIKPIHMLVSYQVQMNCLSSLLLIK